MSGTLTPPGLLGLGTRLDAVAGRQADFEFYDFIPDGIGTLMIGYGQQFAQATPRIRGRRLLTYGLGGLLRGRRGATGRLVVGKLFVHIPIIARIWNSVSVLSFTSVRGGFFCHGRDG
ncbi:MAG: hypothetical protein JNK59_11330 [Sterolibacteriaceae bacterium]|nr:hypothetical protein [Sterolibacteriaceae bacterium]